MLPRCGCPSVLDCSERCSAAAHGVRSNNALRGPYDPYSHHDVVGLGFFGEGGVDDARLCRDDHVAPDRSIPCDGGDGLSHRVLPAIGRVYGLPRRARVLGAPCARLPSRRHREDPSQRQGCELVKRPPCLVGKPQRTFPQIKEHFGAIRPNSLMMRRFIRAGLRLAYTTTRQIVRSRGLLVGLRSMCCSSSPRMPAAPRGRSFCIGVLSLGAHARSRVS